ncbi:MAG: hypothetical protein ACYTEZ_19645 [Planctomycetota bacterium]|jgi:YHS domain-containing protein
MRKLLAALMLLPAVSLLAEGKKIRPVRVPAVVDLLNLTCPIGGKEVDDETTLDWGGVRVHFCCPGCEKKFKKNPAKALAKLGIKTLKAKKGKPRVDLANAKCPIMGGATKERVFSVQAGVRVRHCCPGCGGKAGKDLAKTFAAIGYEFIPSVVDLRNESCPFSGKPVDGKTRADHDGIRVHFCSAGCAGIFEKDPAAAFKKLGVDPDKLRSKTK